MGSKLVLCGKRPRLKNTTSNIVTSRKRDWINVCKENLRLTVC